MREQASKRKKERECVAQILRENSALKEPGWLLTSVAVSTDAKHLHEVNIELYFPSGQYVKTKTKQKTLVRLFICLLYLSKQPPSALKSSAILSWSRKKQVADPHLSHSW